MILLTGASRLERCVSALLERDCVGWNAISDGMSDELNVSDLATLGTGGANKPSPIP